MASLAEALAETLLPAACTRCHGALPWRSSAGGVCPGCWDELAPHRERCCPRCGEPGVAGDDACLGCRVEPPPWAAALSWGPYEGALRDLVVLLKVGGRDELARPLAARMVDAWRSSGLASVQAVVHVPATWWRRTRRGFDQAALLASEVARGLGVPHVGALRRRSAVRQVGRTRAQRLALPAGNFPARASVRGRVLLLDDVMTTGSTAAACTRSLLRAGAAEVVVLTLARTPRPGRIP